MKSKIKITENHLIYQHTPEQFLTVMEMPKGIERNIYFENSCRHHMHNRVNFGKKEDGSIFYSEKNIFYMNINGNIFQDRKRTVTCGFTIKDGKTRIWFNRKVQELRYLKYLFNYLNITWVDHGALQYIISPKIIAMIITRKATNMTDLIKQHIKDKKYKCSPAFLLQAYKALNKVNINQITFARAMHAAKYQDHFLERFYKPKSEDELYLQVVYDHEEDMINQAFILERKIDFNWSDKRRHKIHQAWIKEIRSYSRPSIELVQFDQSMHNISLDKKYFRLITNSVELFDEGTGMYNCVYHNYLSQAQRGDLLIYNVRYKGEITTLGLKKGDDSKGKYYIFQNYQAFNKQPSEAMSRFVEESVSKHNRAITEKLIDVAKQKEKVRIEYGDARDNLVKAC